MCTLELKITSKLKHYDGSLDQDKNDYGDNQNILLNTLEKH